MRTLPGTRGFEDPKISKIKMISRIQNLSKKPDARNKASGQTGQPHLKTEGQAQESHLDALYAHLFPQEGEPIYMPSVALSLFWPDDPQATGQEQILPCMAVLASQQQNIVLDLLPLGRSMASGQVSDTHAVVKAMGLVQEVLEDHSKRISVVTWDDAELKLARQQLLSVHAEGRIELPTVGCSLKVCS
jgi:hypothetical protein